MLIRAILLAAAAVALAVTVAPPRVHAALTAVIDPTPPPNADIVPALLFGTNIAAESNGEGIVSPGMGSQVRDRNFRINATGVDGTLAVDWVYLTGAKQQTGGCNGGSSTCARLSVVSGSGGAVYQLLIDSYLPVQSYTLTFDTFATASTYSIAWSLSKFFDVFAGSGTSPHTTAGAWQSHRITFTSSSAITLSTLAFSLSGTSVNGDYILINNPRFAATSTFDAATTPLSSAFVDFLSESVAITAVRWPGGTPIDWLNWKDTIGPLSQRNESRSAFHLEINSFGLDDFLTLCESKGWAPLLQLNVRDSAEAIRQQIEYVNGASTTVWGARRAANGHTAPYGVRFIELGNEPSANYQTGSDVARTATDYAYLARRALYAALSVDPNLYSLGVDNSQFAYAPFLPVVPILATWDEQVWNGSYSLRGYANATDSHYYNYPGFPVGDTVPALFARMMCGSRVFDLTNQLIATKTGGLPSVLTEYQTFVEADSGAIQTAYLLNYLSGLSIGDQIIQMMKYPKRWAGATIWNAFEAVGYGMAVIDSTTFLPALRPSGLVFQLLRVFGDEPLLAVSGFASTQSTIAVSYGNIPAGTVYDDYAIFATQQTGNSLPRIVLVNRRYDDAVNVTLSSSAALRAFVSATVTTYYASSVLADNEAAPHTAVALTIANWNSLTPISGSALAWTLPPHSIVRIDITAVAGPASSSAMPVRSSTAAAAGASTAQAASGSTAAAAGGSTAEAGAGSTGGGGGGGGTGSSAGTRSAVAVQFVATISLLVASLALSLI